MNASTQEEPKARVLVYQIVTATENLFPLGEDGKLVEFKAGSARFGRELYLWEVHDDIRSVLNEAQSDQYKTLFIEAFAAYKGELERTPANLLSAVNAFRSSIVETNWTQVEKDGIHVALAQLFLNHLELIALTYKGCNDIYVVIQ